MRFLLLLTMAGNLRARAPFHVAYINENDTTGCMQLKENELASFVDVTISYKLGERSEDPHVLWAESISFFYSHAPNQKTVFRFPSDYLNASTFLIYKPNDTYALNISPAQKNGGSYTFIGKGTFASGGPASFASNDWVWVDNVSMGLDCELFCTFEEHHGPVGSMTMEEKRWVTDMCLSRTNSNGEIGCAVDDGAGLVVLPNGGPLRARYARNGFVVYHGGVLENGVFVKRLKTNVCHKLFADYTNGVHHIQLPTLDSDDLFWTATAARVSTAAPDTTRQAGKDTVAAADNSSLLATNTTEGINSSSALDSDGVASTRLPLHATTMLICTLVWKACEVSSLLLE